MSDGSITTDLVSTVSQQITKDGHFDGTTVGIWSAGWSNFGIGNDLPPSTILTVWDHAINMFKDQQYVDDDGGFPNIAEVHFTASGSWGGTAMDVLPDCP